MTHRVSRLDVPTDHPIRPRKKTARVIETTVVALSLAVIAVVIVVDIVRTAPADAPVVQASFDVAPPTGWTLPKPPEERWAADDSSKGTRPDSVH